MQNSSFYSQIKAQIQQPQLQFPEQEQLKCPRCESTNTKFCYYNNYNLSQPRHFCKSCKRYWTKGGALRKIPVGGGSRKNSKRSSAAKRHPPAAASVSAPENKIDDGDKNSGREMAEIMGRNFVGRFGNSKEVNGCLGSVLGSNAGQFGNLLDGIRPNGTSPEMQFGNLLDGIRPNGTSPEINGQFGDSGTGPDMDPHIGLESGSTNNGDAFLNIQGESETGCWSGDSKRWPDLAIHTRRSTFQ